MKGTALILFSVFALSLSDEVELNANGCPVDPEVYKIVAHDTYCNLFYTCVGGERITQRCPANLVYNTEKQACDWPLEVDCGNKGIFEFVPDSEEDKEVVSPGGNKDPSLAPEICAQEEHEGVLVAHEKCNQFYLCDGQQPVAMECPEHLLYNYDSGVCDWPSNVECGDRTISDESSASSLSKSGSILVQNEPLEVYEACAKEDTDGLLLPHETCNRFYKCSFGLPVVLSCPAGLVYNIEKHYCDWKQNVKCGNRPIVEDDNNEVSGGHGHGDPSEAPAICAAEDSDGILVAHEKCNQFYKCYQGAPVTMDCPLNLLYNWQHEYCDWPQNVDCGSRIKSV